jgi:hypothetical protein
MHTTRVYRNRDKLLTCALCVLLALPGLAAAKQPTKSNPSNNTTSGSTTTEGCAVLLPAYIETGTSFSVKVVRVPSYPGSWTQPTIYTDVVYPMSPDSSNTISNILTINRFNVTYALVTFTVPMMESGILTTSTSPDNTAIATVTAMISEPHGKTKRTKCFSTTPVVQGK